MKYAIQINAAPSAGYASWTAYHFIQAALLAGHQILQIFFYQEGIYNAFRYALPPEDEANLIALWSELARDQGVDLVVCISAAQRRGLLHQDEASRQGALDDDLAEGFRLAGLGQWVQATLSADRSLVFA